MPYRENGFLGGEGFSTPETEDDFSDGSFQSLGGYSPENDWQAAPYGAASDQIGEKNSPYQDGYIGNPMGEFDSFMQQKTSSANDAGTPLQTANETVSAPVENSLTYQNVSQTIREDELPPVFDRPFIYEVDEKTKTKKYKDKRRLTIITFVIAVIVSSILIYVMIAANKAKDNYEEFKQNAVTVFADIVDIKETKTRQVNSRTARVSYEYNGRTYSPPTYFSINKSTTMNSKLQLLISPDNPNDVRIPNDTSLSSSAWGTNIAGGAFMGIVDLLFLVSLISFLRFRRQPYDVRFYKTEMQVAQKKAKREAEKARSAYQNTYADRQTRSYSDTGKNGRENSVWTMEFGSSGMADRNSSASAAVGSASGTSSINRKMSKRASGATIIKSGIGLMIVGLIWMSGFGIPAGIMAAQKAEHESFLARADAIDATIVSIRDKKVTSTHHSKNHTRTSSHWEYYATVSYHYGSTTYVRGEFEVPSGQAHEGMTMVVFVDPDNPGDCRVQTNKAWENMVMLRFLAGWGVPFIIVGSIMIVKGSRRRREE